MNEMILDQAQRCRKRFHTSDPFELLESMGVVLVYSLKYPHNGLRGYCTVMNRTKYVVINANQPWEEQRVVAGHEAGHLILHKTLLKTGAFSSNRLISLSSVLLFMK